MQVAEGWGNDDFGLRAGSCLRSKLLHGFLLGNVAAVDTVLRQVGLRIGGPGEIDFRLAIVHGCRDRDSNQSSGRGRRKCIERRHLDGCAGRASKQERLFVDLLLNNAAGGIAVLAAKEGGAVESDSRIGRRCVLGICGDETDPQFLLCRLGGARKRIKILRFRKLSGSWRRDQSAVDLDAGSRRKVLNWPPAENDAAFDDLRGEIPHLWRGFPGEHGGDV